MNNTTELCELAKKYIVDKCPTIYHTYTPLYNCIFENIKDTIYLMLEIGVGNHGIMKYPNYKPGASLRMWRDYFINAKVYGADIIPEVMFEEERIKTFLCDQSNTASLISLYRSIKEDAHRDYIDFIIDDGSHEKHHQIISFLTLWPYIRPNGGIYIIEDVHKQSWHEFTNLASNFDNVEIIYEHVKGINDADCFIAFRKT